MFCVETTQQRRTITRRMLIRFDLRLYNAPTKALVKIRWKLEGHAGLQIYLFKNRRKTMYTVFLL